MKAARVLEHFRAVGTWVDWDHTCDAFLHGDPETEVRGIAVAWTGTVHALDRAAAEGMNLFITHEPIFYEGFGDEPSARALAQAKRALLDDAGMVVLRCHDTWDRMPEFGIPDAWGSFLGFPTQPRATESFYKVCLTEGLSVGEIGERVLERVRRLGQDTVLVLGDGSKKVERLGIGTGAITHLPSMYRLGVDAILATDDGMNYWDGGLWALDLNLPLLIVNHATAEKPGMMAMARYLRQVFPDTPCRYIEVEMPYTSIS